MCIRDKKKLKLSRRLITSTLRLSEAFVSVFINQQCLWLRSTMPHSEITRLQIWEQACSEVTRTLVLMTHTTISDWSKGLLYITT